MPPSDASLVADTATGLGDSRQAPRRPGAASESLGTHVTETLRLAAPISMTHLSYLAMMTITIGLFGVLTPEALGAGGMALRMAISTYVVSGVLLMVGVMVAEAEGARRTDLVPGLYWNGLYMSMALALVSFVWLTFSHHVLAAVDQPPEVVEQTREILEVMRWAEFGNIIRLGLMRSVLPAFGLNRVLYWVTPTSLGLYILLSWILVEGRFGMPAMGFTGIPAAMVVSMTLAAVAMLATVHSPRNRSRIPVAPVSGATMRHILRFGLPIGAQMTVDGAFFLTMAVLVGQLGAVVLGAHQIVHNFGTICYVLAASCGDAAALRISYRRGAKAFGDATVAGYVAFVMGMAAMAVAAGVIYLFPDFFIGLFLDLNKPESAPVMAAALALIPVCTLYVMADGFFGVGMGLQRGLGDNKASFVIVTLSYWGIGFPVGWVCFRVLDMGVIGIWWGLIAGLTAIGTGSLWRYGVMSRAAAEGRLGRRASVLPALLGADSRP